MGALWEIFEFAMDAFFGLTMQKSGLVDTMWDLIVDTVGAAAIAVLGYGWLRTAGTDSFLERWIGELVGANPRLFGGAGTGAEEPPRDPPRPVTGRGRPRRP